MLSLHNFNSYTTMHYHQGAWSVSGSSTGGGEVGVGMGVDPGVWGLSDRSVSKVKLTTCYIAGGC